MAVYKIFPSKDTTLYSQFPDQNTGLDSILEISNKTHNTDPLYISNAEVARSLIAFDNNEISYILENLINNSTWQSNLKLFNSNTTGITTDSILYIHPLAQDWSNGTGRADDYPQTENGASWTWNTFAGGNPWITSSFNPYITASFPQSNPGGGVWYTGSASGSNFSVTQSFGIRNNKDINQDITDIVSSWYSSSINNYGVILKWGSNVEFNSSESIEPNMKLFSIDTHTIYPPQLEFRWNDFTWNTGSSTTTIIDSSNIIISLPNNKGFYNQNSIQKFRVNVRPQYPERVFTTSSIYIHNYYLPTSSYYAVQDLYTNEFVIDFDTNYTKISADEQGNYFNIYMSGLEPERYFKILIKTILDGETLILDDEYYFKVING